MRPAYCVKAVTHVQARLLAVRSPPMPPCGVCWISRSRRSTHPQGQRQRDVQPPRGALPSADLSHHAPAHDGPTGQRAQCIHTRPPFSQPADDHADLTLRHRLVSLVLQTSVRGELHTLVGSVWRVAVILGGVDRVCCTPPTAQPACPQNGLGLCR